MITIYTTRITTSGSDTSINRNFVLF